MYISDIFMNSYIPVGLKHAVVDLIENNNISSSVAPFLIRTDSNDDINGSQHVTGGGTDFTYRDATEDEIINAESLGYYEYFSRYGDVYTGHYYQGEDHHFEAIVVDPPTYAIDINL